MNITWCPVRLFSTDPTLLSLVRNHSKNQSISDFQAVDMIEKERPEQSSLAQILLLDLSQGAETAEAERSVCIALQRNPRDVVIGIGSGFPGSVVAQWVRRGMHGIIDSPVQIADFEKAMLEANEHCVHLRLEQSELRLLSLQRHSISQREEEVLELVVQGVPNKSIATRLDVSQRTIEARRQKIYQKMNAKRLSDLIRALDKLEFLSRTLKQLA
jgi:FixJ family two-component response regulator